MPDYEDALRAAGANVLAFETFGSYQGDWFAVVEYNGERGFVHGYYGSCSGCDALKAAFSWSPDTCDEHRYKHDSQCADCIRAKQKYEKELADFGRSEIEGEGLLTFDAALALATRNSEWDMDAEEMASWLRNHKHLLASPK